MKIILVEASSGGPTARIVEAATTQASGSAVHDEWERAAPAQALEKVAKHADGPLTVLVSVGEENSSLRNGPAGARLACKSLVLAQAIASRFSHLPVHLLRYSDAPALTGIDVVAAMVSGLCGVIDDRMLLSEGALAKVLAHRANDSRSRALQVIGRSTAATWGLVAMLQAWEQNLSGDGTMDLACWRAAMALAQLPQLLPIPGLGDRYSFVKLAQALNLQTPITSFHLTESDLRKVLSSLADLWIESTADRSERVHLPRYARAQGFPQFQPVVAGVTDEELPKRLYDASKDIVLTADEPIEDGVPRAVVRLPNRHLRHLNSRT